MPITAKVNLDLLLNGECPEWIPFTLDVGAVAGMTAPILRLFHEKTGASDPADYFGCDFRTFSLPTRFGGQDPRVSHPDACAEMRFDEWGIGHVGSSLEGTVEKSCPPLARVISIAEVEAYPAPIIETTADLSPIAAHHARGYPVFGYAGSVYEWSWWLRGMETFLTDMLLEPALTEAIVAKVAAFTKQLALASARAGIDVLCFYDDAGMQTGMQMSPELWRRYFRPRWQDILEAVRQHAPGVRTFLHSCGHIRAILPDIVDLGFDMLHPIQPECMDFAEVHRQFGRHITLCATVSSQRIFPFGTPDDIGREVRRLKAVCGPDRRGILTPSNLLQPETPWDNIVAFVEEARAGR